MIVDGGMIINGEFIPSREVRRLMRMMTKDAKKVAADFFDKCRSGVFGDPGRTAKFRSFWSEIGLRCGADPQLCYIESHYTNYIEEVIKIYGGLLERNDVTQKDKDDIYMCLNVQAELGQFSQHTPLQVSRDSQAFYGDSYEHREIAKTYGTHAESSLINKLMTSTKLH